ncbi:MAG: hypothetical protein RMJ57_06165 [Bacteroidia bacterium]|nr:hypothetical protein [Bacteroidia bacterium]
MTLSELRELTRRRGVQVDDAFLEFLLELLGMRSSGENVLLQRLERVEVAVKAVGEEVGQRFEVERAFQERYFTLLREELEKRFEPVARLLTEQKADMDRRFAEVREEMKARFELVIRALAEPRVEMDKRFVEQKAEMDRRFAEQKAEMDRRFAEQQAYTEKRFEVVDRRFEEMNHRFQMLFWLIGGGFTLLTLLMSGYGIYPLEGAGKSE